MQAGFGRTGKAFGFQHYDVTPDLICCGKGMGGGVPLSGVLGRAGIMDLPDVGNMSSTHSANPLVCAAGLAVIEEIEERDLIAETARKGELLFDALGKLQTRFPDRVSRILGRGLIAAVLFKHPQTGEADGSFTSLVAERCMQKGLLVVHTGRESIKIGPPLTITDDALLEGVDVLGEAIAEVASE
jgi:4-aminobutyrate aminotransferase-like enzyme